MILDMLDSGLAQAPPPRPGTDQGILRTARLIRVGADGRTATVSVLGSGPITLPATVTVWSDVTTCWVLCDPATGRPAHVLGPAPAPAGGALMPPLPAEDKPEAVTQDAVVTPTSTGTWTADGWGRWNIRAFEGATDLYQGTAMGKKLVGVATYGEATKALGLDTITAAVLTVVPHPASAPWELVVQPVVESTTPAPAGPTVSTTIGLDTTDPVTVDVTPLAAHLKDGQGLALTGADYGAVSGIGASMSLTLQGRATR